MSIETMITGTVCFISIVLCLTGCIVRIMEASKEVSDHVWHQAGEKVKEMMKEDNDET